MYSAKGELAALHTHCLLGTKDVSYSQSPSNFTGSSRVYHRVGFQSKQKLGVTCDHRQSICPSRPLIKLFVTIGIIQNCPKMPSCRNQNFNYFSVVLIIDLLFYPKAFWDDFKFPPISSKQYHFTIITGKVKTASLSNSTVFKQHHGREMRFCFSILKLFSQLKTA